MLIFGHPWTNNLQFRKVFSTEDLSILKDSEIALLEPVSESIALAQHCQRHSLAYVLTVGSVREALFANALGATFLVCQQEDAMEIQPIAERYLFDTKVLVLIDDDREIERMARFSIDGVVFPQAILHQT